MIRKISPVLALYLLIAVSALGQQKKDSLLAVLDTARNEYKVKTLNELFRANLDAEPLKAVGYAREALNLATEVGDKKGQAASYNNLGIAYRTQGALDKALEYYITGLGIYETLGNKEGIATTKNNISTIYSIKRDYGQAMKYLEESYTLLLEIKDENKLIGSMNNLGNLHTEIQLYEQAMKYYTQAYQLSEQKGKKFADPLNNIGNIYFRQGNYQRAVDSYEKALAIEREQNNKIGALNVITNLGITYAKAKQPEPAQIYLDEALTLTNELQAYSFLPAIYRAVAENYGTQNKWKEAFENQLKYDTEREKMFGEETTRKIAQMEMVMSFQEKEREFDMLKKETEIKTLELRNTRLFVILVVLAVFAVLGGLNLFMGKKSIVNRKK